ncbi:MAG TPA: dihydrodipicolinate reductase C-terminal domain-containing protein, partial [Spirochaetota bacterium]|nr:dihydrodipicolinate reductase C-terminal domain-containing protein [Spirochaetota bacterium]
MKIGLIGFGKTGKIAAATILRNKETCLEWVIRKSSVMEHRSVPEFLGEESDEPGIIHSSEHTPIKQLLDDQPVDMIIDFSSESGILYYGKEAAKRKIKIISAVSHYTGEKMKLLKRLSRHTAVFWSPNITLGVNYLIIAARFIKKLAPHIDMVIIEEHFRDKNGVSGTAKVMAEKLDLDHAEIKSIRAGGIIGKHEIICGFPFQTVRLIHESISR